MAILEPFNPLTALEELQHAFMAEAQAAPTPPYSETAAAPGFLDLPAQADIFPPAPLRPAGTLPGAQEDVFPDFDDLWWTAKVPPEAAAPTAERIQLPESLEEFAFSDDLFPEENATGRIERQAVDVADIASMPLYAPREPSFALYEEETEPKVKTKAVKEPKAAKVSRSGKVKRYLLPKIVIWLGVFVCLCTLALVPVLDDRAAPKPVLDTGLFYQVVGQDKAGSLPADTLYVLDSNATEYAAGDVILLSSAKEAGTTQVVTNVQAAGGTVIVELEQGGFMESVRQEDIFGRVRLSVPKLGAVVNTMSGDSGVIVGFAALTLALIFVLVRLLAFPARRAGLEEQG
ncbi:MAG: hypothetical protein LBN05_00550 [Oscillospiraceae bacterium]|nr:hypothetical protein [Oscillospiraceae bacterium]